LVSFEFSIVGCDCSTKGRAADSNHSAAFLRSFLFVSMDVAVLMPAELGTVGLGAVTLDAVALDAVTLRSVTLRAEQAALGVFRRLQVTNFDVCLVFHD
jgi:hypothetical protein